MKCSGDRIGCALGAPRGGRVERFALRFVRLLWETVFGFAYWMAYMVGGHFSRRGLLRHRGRSVKIAPTAFFKHPGNISIGDNSFINHHCCVWAAPDGLITIGDDVILGPNVCITASNHGIAPGVLIRLQPGQDAPIVIGNDVWLGANVTITAGVSIGDGCVVGAGSVVTRSLPADTICGGIPAKVIRRRGDASRHGGRDS